MEGGGPVGPQGDDAGAVPAPAEARSVVLVSTPGAPSASVPPATSQRDHPRPRSVRGSLSTLARLGILPRLPASGGLGRTRQRQARTSPALMLMSNGLPSSPPAVLSLLPGTAAAAPDFDPDPSLSSSARQSSCGRPARPPTARGRVGRPATADRRGHGWRGPSASRAAERDCRDSSTAAGHRKYS